MVGKVFRCDECEHRYRAGMTRHAKTDALPGARFSRTGDARGLWVRMDDKFYCGACAKEAFPQLLEEGVVFIPDGVSCY